MKKRELSREPQFFTASEWVNREGPVIGPWPLAKKKSGDLSRIKSGQTARALAMLRRLGKEGIK